MTDKSLIDKISNPKVPEPTKLNEAEKALLNRIYGDPDQIRVYLNANEEALKHIVSGRAVYLGLSIPEGEAIESARRYFKEHCSGVKKE